MFNQGLKIVTTQPLTNHQIKGKEGRLRETF